MSDLEELVPNYCHECEGTGTVYDPRTETIKKCICCEVLTAVESEEYGSADL